MPLEAAAPPPAAKPVVLSLGLARQLRLLGICTALLAACFAKPLLALLRLALHSELYSHIPLIPLVSLYLAWSERRSLPGESRPDRKPAALLLGAGLLSILGYAWTLHSQVNLLAVDALAWTTVSFLFFFLGACFLCLGRPALRVLAFPLGFLVFVVPLPNVVETGLVSFLQHASADVAEVLFGLVGTPVFRNDVQFQLPGFALQVAPECSGIRSTLVLFITSFVAGQLFLRSPLKRGLLAFAVIPLGILRNAVRIVTIGELCVHVSPDMLDSDLHHRGGPYFFLVTLVPFFGLLYALRRLDLKGKGSSNVRK